VSAKHSVILLTQLFASTIRTIIILPAPFHNASDVEKVLAFSLQKCLIMKTDAAFLLRKELNISLSPDAQP